MHCFIWSIKCSFLSTASGELYTWGKGGPRLGYESSSRKEVLPRFVEGLEEHRVAHVACGRDHTLGNHTDDKKGRYLKYTAFCLRRVRGIRICLWQRLKLHGEMEMKLYLNVHRIHSKKRRALLNFFTLVNVNVTVSFSLREQVSE